LTPDGRLEKRTHPKKPDPSARKSQESLKDLPLETRQASQSNFGPPLKSPLKPSLSPDYGAGELSGVGTMISGLRPAPPASMAADEIVASLNAGPVMVARPAIGEATLPEVSVASRVPSVGLQAPVMIEVPKIEMADGVAPGGSCGDSVPIAPTALLASRVVLGIAAAIPVVGQIMIVPMVLPGIEPNALRLS